MYSDLKRIAAERLREGKANPTIRLTDTTFRDAHQCLWATRMTTEEMLPVAPVLDEAGYETMECMGLVQYDASALFLNQNPLERLKLLCKRIRRAPVRAAVRSNLMRGFFPVAADVTDFFIERQVMAGVGNIMFLESLHAWENVTRGAQTAKRLGVETTALVLFNVAPSYDDDYYASVCREAVENLGVTRIFFNDAGGIITPERTRTIVPAMKAAIGETKLEFATHCLTGLGPLAAIEAAVYGADTIFTAIEPLANGPSVPGAQMITRNLRELGFDVPMDDDAMAKAESYFCALADRKGQPVGEPAEYNPQQYETQYAGGALANMVSQLKAMGIEERLPEVLEEIARVRRELGSPIMATPFPAIVAAQAVMNMLQGERYRVVPDEVKKFVCGHYGSLRIPVDPDVLDRIMENGATEISEVPPEIPDVLPHLRSKYGDIDDDELLIRYMYGDERFEGLSPTGKSGQFSISSPIVDLVVAMIKQKPSGPLQVSGLDFSVSLG
jgi:oxaloacetate decarboxylase alpha subunit